MEKRETTDIFGKKLNKNTKMKSAKQNLSYRYLLGVRTPADVLTFSKMIYTETNYLFYISPDRFRMEDLDKSAEFQVFIHKDVISENKVFYLQNIAFEKDKTVLGCGENALFQLKQQKQPKRKKQKKINQISMSFNLEDEDFTASNQEYGNEEIRIWHECKSGLAENSAELMGKIDYLFPIQIETYEILKPLLQHFHKIQEIKYILIEPKQIKDAELFFMYINFLSEQINFSEKSKKVCKKD